MVILNEVYFGESLITDRIVDVISQTMNTKIDLKSNKTKELLEELCDAIKDFCGARLVEIDMEEDTWGYTIAPPYKKRPEYKITKNGVRFKDNKEVVLIVTLNPKILFKDPKKKNLLTPRELTAVLLHEIGHSFVIRGIGMKSHIAQKKFYYIYSMTINAIIALINPVAGITGLVATASNTTNKGKELKINTNKIIR